LRAELGIAARQTGLVGLHMMEQNRNCILCGSRVKDSSLTFEQRLIEDEDFCAPCWKEIMHDGRDMSLQYDPRESVKVSWVN